MTANQAKKKEKNRWLSYLVDGILSGLMIGIGGIVNFSCDSRYLGAFLFSLGLYSIIQFRYGLYTGKVGYLFERDRAYVSEVFFTLLANGIGVASCALLISLTRFANSTITGLDVTMVERASSAMNAKLSDSPLSSFVLAIFCGMLMFTAVQGHTQLSKKGNYPGSLFLVILPIMVFILSGFNHCVADLFTYVLAGCPEPGKALVYFPVVILGNAVGGVAIPLLKRGSNLPLFAE